MQAEMTAFVIGLLNAASLCIVPLYPGFPAYLSGGQLSRLGRGRVFVGFFVLAGALCMMLALGGLIALVSVAIDKVLTIFYFPGGRHHYNSGCAAARKY
jgi:cytochrome c-type biogenesis protein